MVGSKQQYEEAKNLTYVEFPQKIIWKDIVENSDNMVKKKEIVPETMWYGFW